MMKSDTASGARRRTWALGICGEGSAVTVACASAMPLVVLGVAVAADYANFSRYRTHVQLAAEAASRAGSEAIATNHAGALDDGLVESVAIRTFALNAPSGAFGRPTVAVKSRASLVTTTVDYQGMAPSNFGSALGYGVIRVSASTIAFSVVADSSNAKTSP